MEYIIKQNGDRKYIDCSGNFLIEDEKAALELMGICGEEGTDCVILHSAYMSGDFFILNTGLAGKFYELALETNRGDQFRIFYNGQEAEQWLIRE